MSCVKRLVQFFLTSLLPQLGSLYLAALTFDAGSAFKAVCKSAAEKGGMELDALMRGMDDLLVVCKEQIGPNIILLATAAASVVGLWTAQWKGFATLVAVGAATASRSLLLRKSPEIGVTRFPLFTALTRGLARAEQLLTRR